MAMEGQRNNEIRAGVRIGDIGQYNILVSLDGTKLIMPSENMPPLKEITSGVH